MWDLLLLAAGLTGLILGANLVIRGSLNIAEHYKISKLFIGLTVLAVGTDLPELFLDITAAIQRLGGTETSDLIIGETIGTCFAQLLLMLGLVGLLNHPKLKRRQLIRDGSMLLGSVLLLFLAGFDGLLSQLDGAIFVMVYLFYFASLYREEKVKEKVARAPKLDKTWVFLSIIGGFIVLIVSSDLVIDSAVRFAETWGVAQSLVGIVLVGLGTSLPELALSASALRKREGSLIVGNLIGSNIFDVLFTLGIGTTISGFLMNKDLLFFDVPFLFAASTIVLLLLWRNLTLSRKKSIVLLLIYFTYITLKLIGY